MSKQINCNDCHKEIINYDTRCRVVWNGIEVKEKCWTNIHNDILVCKDCYKKDSGIFGETCQLCDKIYLNNDDTYICHHPYLELCSECLKYPNRKLCNICSITQNNLFCEDYICECGGTFIICDGIWPTWDKVEYNCESCHKKDSEKMMLKTRLYMREQNTRKNKMRKKVLIQEFTCGHCSFYNLCSDCMDPESGLCRQCYMLNAWNEVLLRKK